MPPDLPHASTLTQLMALELQMDLMNQRSKSATSSPVTVPNLDNMLIFLLVLPF